MEISLTMLAAGTTESLWAEQAKQMLLTCFFRTNFFLKLRQTKVVSLHRLAPFSNLFKKSLSYILDKKQYL
jgi:hypothetical protein